MESSLTFYEALDLITNTSDQLDTLFYYWISASFAVIVTAYMAKDHLNLPITLGISVLYILASIMFAARFYAMINLIVFYQSTISEYLPAGVNDSIPILQLIRSITYISGLLITELYLWYSYTTSNKSKVINIDS